VAVPRARGGAPAWDLGDVLAELGRLEIAALLVEGGSRLFTSFIENGLADKAVLTLAPLLLGSAAAPSFVGGEGVDKIARAFAFRRTRSFGIEDDIIMEGYF
jgi:diaminohydroxyphosphoribosylaminopyrimidine deaminase/5-amino-6-(5-phosphoribosylamino)uracil reductase